MTKKKETMKVGEALGIFNRLNTAEILQIRDTQFAKQVVKNVNTLLPLVETADKYKRGSDEWVELTKDITTNEEYEALEKDEANAELVEARLKEMEEYKTWLESDYNLKLEKIKVNNIASKLSAEDLLILSNVVEL